MERLRRFLILGTEGGSYYASQRALTDENAAAVRAALDELGVDAVAEIVAVSRSGRAHKNDYAILALAMAAGHKDAHVRKAALTRIPDVCRTGTHLFMFCEFVQHYRGWGRSLARAVAAWYEDAPVGDVAYQAVKYRQRNGWTHRDVLRKAHPHPDSETRNALYKFITAGSLDGTVPADLGAVDAYQRAQASPTPAETAKLIERYGGKLPREALLTDHLADPAVNEALVRQGMPLGALLRNLANLTRYGVVRPMGDTTRFVVERLTDAEAIRKARIHPIAVLAAMTTYQSGRGARGSNTWEPVREVVDALDAMFYAAFENVEPTGKRHMLALDVSGSMEFDEISGIPGLTPRIASAAMAMVTARSGDPFMAAAFATQFTGLDISPRQRLDDVLATVGGLPFGGTDCALPMLVAAEQGFEIDTFIVYTDSETWHGRVHPAQALQAYREKTGIDARLVVVGMVSNGFSIADPRDRGMLDVVGFDTASPQFIADFSAGRI